ncbi:hypothetical protein EV126DRAFT_254125 [Verticillium dahliae]|nr:hypothetical protein EV126DRAFT_254125 [Verticillium dahliae]
MFPQSAGGDSQLHVFPLSRASVGTVQSMSQEQHRSTHTFNVSLILRHEKQLVGSAVPSHSLRDMAPNVILLIQSGTRQLERLYLGELVQTSGHPIPYELRQRELEKTFRLRYEPSQGQIHEIRAEFAVRSDYAQAMHIFQCLGLRASVTRDASSPIHVLGERASPRPSPLTRVFSPAPTRFGDKRTAIEDMRANHSLSPVYRPQIVNSSLHRHDTHPLSDLSTRPHYAGSFQAPDTVSNLITGHQMPYDLKTSPHFDQVDNCETSRFLPTPSSQLDSQTSTSLRGPSPSWSCERTSTFEKEPRDHPNKENNLSLQSVPSATSAAWKTHQPSSASDFGSMLPPPRELPFKRTATTPTDRPLGIEGADKKKKTMTTPALMPTLTTKPPDSDTSQLQQCSMRDFFNDEVDISNLERTNTKDTPSTSRPRRAAAGLKKSAKQATPLRRSDNRTSPSIQTSRTASLRNAPRKDSNEEPKSKVSLPKNSRTRRSMVSSRSSPSRSGDGSPGATTTFAVSKRKAPSAQPRPSKQQKLVSTEKPLLDTFRKTGSEPRVIVVRYHDTSTQASLVPENRNHAPTTSSQSTSNANGQHRHVDKDSDTREVSLYVDKAQACPISEPMLESSTQTHVVVQDAGSCCNIRRVHDQDQQTILSGKQLDARLETQSSVQKGIQTAEYRLEDICIACRACPRMVQAGVQTLVPCSEEIGENDMREPRASNTRAKTKPLYTNAQAQTLHEAASQDGGVLAAGLLLIDQARHVMHDHVDDDLDRLERGEKIDAEKSITQMLRNVESLAQEAIDSHGSLLLRLPFDQMTIDYIKTRTVDLPGLAY